jgi:acyl-CoA synthetase (AMP-forming)/AMP-acid ligase II
VVSDEIGRRDADLTARRVVTGLRERGIEPGAMVAFSCPNSPALLAAVFGCLRGGYAPVVLSATLTTYERDDMLADLPIALVIDVGVLGALCGTSLDIGRGAGPALSDHFGCRPLHFTSGTSGRPKAVWSGWLTEGAAAALADDEHAVWRFGPADRHLVNAPLSHSAPLRFALNTLLHGGSVVVPPSFDPSLVRDLLEGAAVTTTFMAPAHLQRLLTQTPPRRHGLRLVAHAGSACPAWVKELALEHLGAAEVTEFYGSTEAQFTVCTREDWATHPSSVGRARPGRELRVVDGQIWCRTPEFARFEYWGDADKTAAAWDGDWVTVGDLGRLDADGFLHLDGRRSDLVVTGGVNVYPAEVERVLGELRGVDKICVVGVDDEQWGQRVCAVLTGEVTEDEVRAYAATHLAPYKRPKTYAIVEQLPLTHSGKTDRTRVAEALAAGGS